MDRTARKLPLACLALLLSAAFGASQAAAAPLSTVPPLVQVQITSGYDYYAFEGLATDTGDGSLGISGVGERPGDFLCEWSLTVDPDPMIMGTFTLTNLNATAQAFTMTAGLPVAPLPAPTVMGGYMGDVTVTDSNGAGPADGSALLETTGPNPLYQALINGTAVKDLIGTLNLPACCGVGASGVLGQVTWGTPIPSAVGPALINNMQVTTRLTLSAGDKVTLPFLFRVEAATPEPTTGLLLGMAAAALLAIRRRA